MQQILYWCRRAVGMLFPPHSSKLKSIQCVRCLSRLRTQTSVSVVLMHENMSDCELCDRNFGDRFFLLLPKINIDVIWCVYLGWLLSLYHTLQSQKHTLQNEVLIKIRRTWKFYFSIEWFRMNFAHKYFGVQLGANLHISAENQCGKNLLSIKCNEYKSGINRNYDGEVHDVKSSLIK